MPDDNYYFIDGSCLIADTVSLKSKSEFASRKLNAALFADAITSSCAQICGGGYYKRFVFYFVNGESRIDDNIILPDSFRPGEAVDLQVKFCGKKIQGSSKVSRWVEANQPPKFVLDRLRKSEKAVDTQICCDALQLACSKKLDRLLLYTNDSDFIPLAHTLKSLGCNASLFRLTGSKVNKELTREFDSFTVLTEPLLREVFVLLPTEDPQP